MRASWLVVGLILVLAGPTTGVFAQDLSRVGSGSKIRLKPDGTISWVEGVYRGRTDDDAIRVEVGRGRNVTLFAPSDVSGIQVGRGSGPSVGQFAKVGSLVGAAIGTAVAIAGSIDCDSSELLGCPGLGFSVLFIGVSAGAGGIIGALSGVVFRISVGTDWYDVPLESLVGLERDQAVHMACEVRF